MTSRKPLDALSALVMAQNAAPDDLLIITPGMWKTHRARRYCMRHLEERVHRRRHLNDAVKQPMGDICRMIARDDIVDFLRKGEWHMYELTRSRSTAGCPHCRLEEKRRGRVHG